MGLMMKESGFDLHTSPGFLVFYVIMSQRRQLKEGCCSVGPVVRLNAGFTIQNDVALRETVGIPNANGVQEPGKSSG
jgi:hypothetical protein